MSREPVQAETRVVGLGRSPAHHFGAVNTPVYRASTILYPSADAWLDAQKAKKSGKRQVSYGRHGTPTSHDLEDALCELEGGARTFLSPSGLAAVYQTLCAVLTPSSRLVIADNAYQPSRSAAEHLHHRLGVEVVTIDPCDADALRAALQVPTDLVLIESPGSRNFHVCDVDAVAAAAHSSGALVAMDNTWATPLLFRPLEHGVDLSIQALTKYVSGHSDLLAGAVTVNERALDLMQREHMASGTCLAGDDCYLALRGLRTLAVRLTQHHATGLALARWLDARPEVARVMHPGLPGHVGHPYWRDTFRGASGLFAVDVKGWNWEQTRLFLNGLRRFGIGASWGGFESLALPFAPVDGEIGPDGRPFARIRFHAGLEDPGDLIKDLEAALAAVTKAEAQ